MKAILLKIENGYNFWKLIDGVNIWWNITPVSEKMPPLTGYDKEYIEAVKHQKFDSETEN